MSTVKINLQCAKLQNTCTKIMSRNANHTININLKLGKYVMSVTWNGTSFDNTKKYKITSIDEQRESFRVYIESCKHGY